MAKPKRRPINEIIINTANRIVIFPIECIHSFVLVLVCEIRILDIIFRLRKQCGGAVFANCKIQGQTHGEMSVWGGGCKNVKYSQKYRNLLLFKYSYIYIYISIYFIFKSRGKQRNNCNS